MADELEIHGLMPHNSGYPLLSRDWEDIDCQSLSCMNNRLGKCGIPSLAKIGDDGRCTGFAPWGLVRVVAEEKQE